MSASRTIAVIGSGAAGLSVAYHLKPPFTLYEKEPHPGGICRSETIAGCTFDYAPRVLLPGEPYAHEVCREVMGDELAYLPFSDWSYHHRYNLYTRYSIQKHMHGLPAEEIMRCLAGMVEATSLFDQQAEEPFTDYLDLLYRSVGHPLADMVIVPQERKKWKSDLRQIDPRWAPRRVARPNLEAALRGATHDTGAERAFGYPLRGGMGALMGALARHVPDLRTDTTLRAIRLHEREAVFHDGQRHPYSALVSTLPLPLLVGMIDQVPDHIRQIAAGLQHVSLQCVCLVTARRPTLDKHFIYVHDPDFIFHRLSLFHNLTEHMAPAGRGSLVAEVSHIGQPDLAGDALVQRVWDDVCTMGVLNPDNTLVAGRVLPLPYAYPLMTKGWREQVRSVLDFLEQHHIYSLGRFAEWEYLNIHDLLPRGRDLAARLEQHYGVGANTDYG